jgi:carboxymethylenebutenolidase
MSFVRSFVLVSTVLFATAQDPAKEQLDKSPRHHEWVQIKQGERTLRAFVAYPEVKAKPRPCS